jgi:hypothetical protein
MTSKRSKAEDVLIEEIARLRARAESMDEIAAFIQARYARIARLSEGPGHLRFFSADRTVSLARIEAGAKRQRKGVVKAKAERISPRWLGEGEELLGVSGELFVRERRELPFPLDRDRVLGFIGIRTRGRNPDKDENGNRGVTLETFLIAEEWPRLFRMAEREGAPFSGHELVEEETEMENDELLIREELRRWRAEIIDGDLKFHRNEKEET